MAKAPRAKAPAPEHTPEEIARFITAGKAALRYGWYIKRVYEDKIDSMQRSIDGAHKAMAEPIEEGPHAARHHDMRDGLRRLNSQVEWALRDYKAAFEALKAAGIE